MNFTPPDIAALLRRLEAAAKLHGISVDQYRRICELGSGLVPIPPMRSFKNRPPFSKVQRIALEVGVSLEIVVAVLNEYSAAMEADIARTDPNPSTRGVTKH